MLGKSSTPFHKLIVAVILPIRCSHYPSINFKSKQEKMGEGEEGGGGRKGNHPEMPFQF